MSLREVISALPQEKAEEIIEAVREKALSLDRLSSLTLGLNPFANSIEINAARKAGRLMAEIVAEMRAGLGGRKLTKDPKDSYRIDI
ncbi:MAG: hypothetical protein M0R06_06920 [Sphaerochaeta sp.]|jgi:hypothetical protein|nr:hypothetical protein [Sphaerochaeta sp.]